MRKSTRGPNLKRVWVSEFGKKACGGETIKVPSFKTIIWSTDLRQAILLRYHFPKGSQDICRA